MNIRKPNLLVYMSIFGLFYQTISNLFFVLLPNKVLIFFWYKLYHFWQQLAIEFLKTKVLMTLCWKEFTLFDIVSVSAHSLHLGKSICEMYDLNIHVFTLMEKSLFRNRCFSLFDALMATHFLHLKVLVVSRKYQIIYIKYFQWLLQLARFMVCSFVFVSFISNLGCDSFPGSSLFVFCIALKLLDISLILSAYCWLMSSC